MLAIHGGPKVRETPMPPRFALDENAKEEIMAVLKYYREKGEDPGYSGVFETKFCQEFCTFMGGGYTDAVATGTGAIYVAMKALELPPNCEVIISPVTDSGALSCIIEQGHIPVVCDSAIGSYNTNLEQIEKRVTERTKLLQITHAGGEPVDILPIVEFAHSKGIAVLEDCSQAIGAKSQGKFVGSYGDVAAFSTMYRKNLSANGSSGLTYTNDENIHKKLLSYADRGKILWDGGLDMRDPNHALFPALNWNTDEISCAIGRASLRRLALTNEKRVSFVLDLIDRMKGELKSFTPYNFSPDFAPFYLPIFVNEDKLGTDKLTAARAVAAEGIGLGEHYGCIVSTWSWAQNYLKASDKTPNAVKTRDRCFHLYLNENYGKTEVDDIITAMAKVEDHFMKS